MIEIASFSLGTPRLLILPGGSLQLRAEDTLVLVENLTGGPVGLIPPAVPAMDQQLVIKDWAGTVGIGTEIGLVGTVDGEVNPTLLTIAYSSTQLLFYNGVIGRLR